MAVKCAHCRGTDVVYGFDSYQCLSCGGYTKHDQNMAPTVPTSALEEEGATYDGPGAPLVADPDNPPFQAKDPVR